MDYRAKKLLSLKIKAALAPTPQSSINPFQGNNFLTILFINYMLQLQIEAVNK